LELELVDYSGQEDLLLQQYYRGQVVKRLSVREKLFVEVLVGQVMVPLVLIFTKQIISIKIERKNNSPSCTITGFGAEVCSFFLDSI
jgi:hypothetical protein